MLDIGVGLSTEKDPGLAAREAIRLAKATMHRGKIDLAVAFSSVDLASQGLLKALSDSLDEIPLIGCSAAAVISKDGIFKHGLAVMLLGLPEEVYFNTACVNQIKTKTPLEAGKELGEKLLYAFQNIRRDLSVILADGLMQESSSLIYGLQQKLGKSFPLVGGSASDNLRFSRTYLYFNRELSSDAACGILWGGRLSFGVGIRHGWKPLGKPRYVTKSGGNTVYQIDGAPAADVYKEYLACDLARLKKELKYVSVLYPIGIYLSGEEEYLLRNILSIEDDGSLVFQGDVPEGSQIRLMIGTKESCLTSTRQAVDEAAKDLISQSAGSKKKETKRFALVFDSVSRYLLLRREAYRELEIIREKLGEDTPIIGLCTYGEQAPLRAINYRGQTHFHNQTIAVLIIEG